MDLMEEFSRLTWQKEGELPATRISRQRADFLAKRSDGSPAILLRSAGAPIPAPSIRLTHLEIDFECICRVAIDGEILEDEFVVIHCGAEVAELHEIFIRTLAAASESLPVDASTTILRRRLQELLDLFRAFGSPGPKDVIGLWGELFVIARSQDPRLAVDAWRHDPFAVHDFTYSAGTLEVKATTRSERIHSFSLDQVSKSSLVASVMLRPEDGGVGILQLGRRIDSMLGNSPFMREKLWRNIVQTLGSNFSVAMDREFDEAFAAQHLLIFSGDDIPSPARPDDHRILDVHFTVDLTSVMPRPTKGVAVVGSDP